VQRIRSEFLAQALQGAGDVFFHGLGSNSTVPRDLRVAHAGDPVEQVHLARALGQLEQGLPQQGSKPLTRFSVVDVDGKRAVKIEADESYGNLIHPVQATVPMKLSWQWRIEKPLENADLRQRGGDDTAVKVCVSFDHLIDNIPFTDRQILRIARGKTSEPVPAASVCYVWDAKLAAGTALDNAFTRRIRYIVLQSGNDRLDRWVSERRDLAADFMRLFKDESPTGVPPIIAIAIGADSDNTKSRAVSYVSGVVLEP